MDATATRLAAAAWLAGVGLLGFRWLSPLAGFYERAILATRCSRSPRPSSITYEVPDPGNRRERAATSWRTFREDPLFGSGPGSYPGLKRARPSAAT